MAAPTKSPWSSVHRTAGQTRWESVTTMSNVVTHKTVFHTRSYVELGAGLNVTNAEGQFVPANPSFTITPTGAEALGAAHQVIVPGDLGGGAGVSIITPQGHALVFQPLAVNYFDPVDGRSVLLGTVTNAIGWLVVSNEIIFSNCFTHLKASIRLRNTRAGLESDLILHERPPAPDAFGLSAATRLEMLTEQLAGVAPARREILLRRERNPDVRVGMLEPDFTDVELSFAGMKMVAGRAYLTPAPTNAPFTLPGRVGKSFLNLEGRRILIEAVEHRTVRAALEQLPPFSGQLGAGLAPTPRAAGLAGRTRSLPGPFRAPPSASAAIQQARWRPAADPVSALAAAPSFVLDYCLVSIYGETDFTFRGDTTYHVSGPTSLSGTTTIEGGTVVKLSGGSGLTLFAGDTLVCDTTNHLPAVFTSYDDNSVGEDLGGSGSPGQIATWGFYFAGGGSWEFSNVRFTHLSHPFALESGGGSSLTLRHLQVRDATCVVDAGVSTINIFNGLLVDCDTLLISSAAFRGEHLTVHNATEIGYADSAAITNSLLVAVLNPPSNVSTYVEATTTNLASAAGVFQTVEGGGYYLTNDTYRNTGTTNIETRLRASLADLTTRAPETLSGTLTTNRTLARRAIRDTDAPDRGYHYAAVDYLAKNLTVENATLTLQDGVVVAGGFDSGSLWTPALKLNPGKLVSLGTPLRPNRLLRANQVQENVQERAYTLLQDGEQDVFKPEITLRFTELSSLADETYLLVLVQDTSRFEASHSAFLNGRHLLLTLYGGSQQWVGLTNNLFHSTHVLLTGNSPAHFGAANNLFKDGAFTVAGGYSPWTFSDNIFDRTALTNSDASTVTTTSNAYVAVATPYAFDSAPVVLTDLAYMAGPLGRYYLADATLVNAGSRSADDAGLYHFTTTTNQHKETNSTVDIGFHYVSLNGAHVPKDSDTDGLADYAEDANGNGTIDASESSFISSDTDGDGRADAQELFIDGTVSTVFTPTRLAYFSFNDTNWLGEAGQTPLGQSNTVSREAWLSKGLSIDNSTNGLLRYREIDTDLNANLLLANGSIRFWFKSSWDTGTGPGLPGRLIELGTKGGTTTNGWWSLYLDAYATNLIFAAETNNVGTTYLTGTISWQRCDWNQIVLNYTPTNSALYLNSTLISTGGGVTLWPEASVRSNGFTVGSDANGTNQAGGLFEDLEIFNYPLTGAEIIQNFQTNRPPNAIGDLKLWLFAAESSMSFGSSNRVENWNDQSCQQNHATQLTTISQPYWETNAINGHPALRFSSSFLNFSNFLSGGAPAQVFVVLKAATNVPSGEIAHGLWGFGTSGNNSAYPAPNGTVEDDFGGSTAHVASRPFEDIGQYHILDITADTNHWALRYNGITKFFTHAHTVSFPSGPILGKANDHFAGHIAEVILYRHALLDGERQRVINYLQQKYAVLPVPPVPVALNALAVATNQVSLWWRADFLPAQNWTKIERSTNGGSFVEVGAVPGASFIDTNLVAGTTYTYRLRASSDRANDSGYSTNLTVTTPGTGADIPLARTKIWLKADSGTTRTSADVMLVWMDQSGHGNHATRIYNNTPKPPIFLTNGLNGHPVTRWGTNLHQTLDLPDLSGMTEGEAFVALKTNPYLLDGTAQLWQLGVLGCAYPVANTPFIDDRFGSSGAFAHVISNILTTNYTYHLYSAASRQGGTTNFWSHQFNNETRISYANSPGQVSFPIAGQIGSRDGSGFVGDILEFVLFDRVLTDSERESVRGYFNARYNLWN